MGSPGLDRRLAMQPGVRNGGADRLPQGFPPPFQCETRGPDAFPGNPWQGKDGFSSDGSRRSIQIGFA